ncbi:uncharacterized protein C9orf40 homolog isoform X1 [Microcaecilia unicolor]|uniref:Uncharacterized protein C9orf40 homolog isoform X1 n=1 Tax=Microcaecilia unicolor TaxID=1415580 RepID=A0A6P7X4G9_9AMPH|nr:uncharacterized protein C9orf40 homolog isoform X1 [Microcaecilia unicolor]
MHATQPLAVTPRKQAQLLQQELGSGRCRAKRKAPSPPGPCKRFLPEQQQHGRVPRREAGSGGEGDGSHAAPCMCKRKQESGGGSPANLEKKRQRREAPGEQQQEEDFGQFSSFQYWRTPLPKLDLSDLLGLDGESMAEETASSSAEGVEMAMES